MQPSTPYHSLCCGALPERSTSVRGEHVTGFCARCHQWSLFAPGGVLETQPRWLRLPHLPDTGHGRCADPQAAREAQLRAIERRAMWRDLFGSGLGLVLLGLCLVALIGLGLLASCQPEAGEGAGEGGGEVGGGGGLVHPRRIP
jgi:hypothetical protein